MVCVYAELVCVVNAFSLRDFRFVSVGKSLSLSPSIYIQYVFRFCIYGCLCVLVCMYFCMYVHMCGSSIEMCVVYISELNRYI